MLVKTTDGTPDAVKVARPVWSGGKSGDNFKGLPITISREIAVHSIDCVYLVRGERGRKNLNTLLDLLNESETREEDETYQNPVDMMFQELEERDPQHFAVRQYKKYKMAAGDICSK